MAWIDQLRPASFRGVPFGVRSADQDVGRRKAVHEYPYRDKPWTEDLGRRARGYQITGFLIEDSAVYGGGSVIAQRDEMQTAAETEGAGTLVHPTLGPLEVDLLSLNIGERWNEGRYFELTFRLVEAGVRTFPTTSSSTGSEVASKASALQSALSGDFAGAMGALGGSPLLSGGLTSAASAFTSQLGALAGDATALVGLASRLSGPYGRFFSGGNSSAFSGLSGSPYAAGTTVAQLVGLASSQRSAVLGAGRAVELSVAGMGFAGGPARVAADVQSAVGALASACADPSDGIRVLSGMSRFVVSAPSAAPFASLVRRSSLSALSSATSVYQPSSYDDAAAMRSSVTGFFDAEIELAGDAGQDASFNALRDLRQAVVRDLSARGGGLARVAPVSAAVPMPGIVMASRLYGDARRSDEVISQANPAHPLFMPINFQALAR